MIIREYGTLKLQPSGAGGVHPYHEILYIDNGESELHWMGRSYMLSSPVLLVIPAHTPHWLTPAASGVRGWYMEADIQQELLPGYEVILQWNQMQSGAERIAWSQPLLAGISAVTSIIVSYETGELDARTAHQLLEWDIRKLLLLVRNAVAASAQAAALPDSSPSSSPVERHLYPLLRYMERFYTDNITIEELSQMCNLTPSYVIRLFKQTFGATPIQYLQELRLKAAISYLGSTDLPVQQIAELTGFSNLHYFSRIFKMKVGESPSTWRKRVAEQGLSLPIAQNYESLR
ncbi:AraC family transcriptional regulator [Cohnella sp. GbtcB17]|uniref:helix-turn-helix domain-containing protein n=1 Tax=Cohnella sp. GbtcB17 TaxID=2824762 RepID=UPI001C2FDD4A|nr:AraC family transcriptional regulator [Cohnella sp. GbtcB17]